MKIETDQVLRSTASADRPFAGWGISLSMLVAAIALLLGAYWDTARSITSTWANSETFAHGYAIVPIALWLLWTRRRHFLDLAPRGDWLGLVFFAAAGFIWLVGAAGQAQIVQQYALVAMIVAAVVALTGRKVAAAAAFPLAFLFLAIPVGEGLLPTLMNWTADFTVGALRASGIPVYREGTFFALPSGQWSVVEACSGLRYLIASVTIGAVYAYVTYTRLWKRVAFIAFSVAVPIIANFLRAYMIVMIGHLSSMKLAVGVDHIIYGWLFFGVVILLLFWLGSFWRDPPAEPSPASGPRIPVEARPAAGVAVGIAILAAAWPLYATHLEEQGADRGAPVLGVVAAASGWQADAAPLTAWRPHYAGAAASLFQVYRKDGRAVAMYLAYYRDQRQGSELVHWANSLTPQDGLWTKVGGAARTEALGGPAFELREANLRSPTQRLLVWEWYRVGPRDLASPYLAKAALAGDRLLGRGDDSAAIILATPYEARPEDAAETLHLFIQDMLPSINAVLADAQGGGK